MSLHSFLHCRGIQRIAGQFGEQRVFDIHIAGIADESGYAMPCCKGLFCKVAAGFTICAEDDESHGC